VAATSPVRIDDDLYDSAKAAGERMSRSAAQQVSHWARIGRELEAGASVSHRQIADVLAGRSPYDALNAYEQSVVRAEWSERIDERIAQLDLARHFTAHGQSSVEIDETGNVVRHEPAQPPGPAV
jgi:hypothetical protein